jgi:hypothetical protein
MNVATLYFSVWLRSIVYRAAVTTLALTFVAAGFMLRGVPDCSGVRA